jgi:hypothetical protein
LFQKLFGRGGGDPPDLEREMEKAMNGLSAVMSAHDATWQIGNSAWDVDQEAGTIAFTTAQGVRAEAPVQIIGTYNTQDGTWLCSEQDCWAVTALAHLLCGANGAYRGPSGPTMVFMTFGELRLSKAAR